MTKIFSHNELRINISRNISECHCFKGPRGDPCWKPDLHLFYFILTVDSAAALRVYCCFRGLQVSWTEWFISRLVQKYVIPRTVLAAHHVAVRRLHRSSNSGEINLKGINVRYTDCISDWEVSRVNVTENSFSTVDMPLPFIEGKCLFCKYNMLCIHLVLTTREDMA